MIKFVIGYFIGMVLTSSIFFGAEMVSLYDYDIKKIFSKFKRK